MSELFDFLVTAIAIISLCLGSLGVVLGALGLIRLGDVYQRMHGAGIVDTGGAGLILFGLLLLSPDWTVAVRVALIGMLIVFTSPTATHAIARAATLAGIEPILARRSRKKPQKDDA
ncbi:monovalent cation/H(+) antiporter subunit G [Alphaproteobacteria bacterium]|jgi:multicomponent Na+:H+ antiporter subunit G|nr:monovalent cation/H(+) antiporter subunit G [Alphaproteobacteria bacterium]